MKKKKILILGANPETVSLILKAKEMGFITYVTDYNPDAYAKKYADVPVNIDASHVDELVKFVKSNEIDGVLVGVAEALMPSYYHVCKKLNYPCFATIEQFDIMTSKDKFKNICRKYNVPVVTEYSVDTNGIQFPVVIKPVDSCSSKGISICQNEDELQTGICAALKFSRSGKYLIEKYMTGEEVVIYYVIQNGNPFLVGMCDRYTNKEQKGVAQLPTSYIFPSHYLESYIKNTDTNVRNMLKGMKINNGVLFLQAFIDNGEVRIYEPGFRLNGAQEHIILSELTGVDAKQLLLNYAVTGRMGSFSIQEKVAPYLHGKYGCKLSPLVKVGRIKKIVGIDKIRNISGVISVNPSYVDGDIVDGIGTLKQIICRFYIVANTKNELKSIIDKIYDAFDVLDENDNSMLITQFDTDIIKKIY
jgi:biotin carboxylase